MFTILNRGGSRSLRVIKPGSTVRERPEEPTPAIEARKLILAGQGWDDVIVQGHLDLSNQAQLMFLPDGLRCASLNVSGCTNLEHLPERLEVRFLDVSGCTNLKDLPPSIRFQPGAALEVARNGLQGLPAGVRVRLLWNGVHVDERLAFRPETITGQGILEEDNLEVRRVMLERIGLERFVDEVGGLILNRDSDAGGERKLVRVPFPDDEDIVVVCLTCPSTGHEYVLRVPPWMRTCRQAVAWIAGFEDPNDYQPIAEA